MGGLTDEIKGIHWWHVAEIYLVSLFSKSSCFRQCFREFAERLEKNEKNYRKKHKILPLLFSFVSKLTAKKENFSHILIQIYSKIKDIISEFTDIPPHGILFRLTVSAIGTIMFTPRKWDLEIDISRDLKKSLQATAVVFISTQLQPNYPCSNSIESD